MSFIEILRKQKEQVETCKNSPKCAMSLDECMRHINTVYAYDKLKRYGDEKSSTQLMSILGGQSRRSIMDMNTKTFVCSEISSFVCSLQEYWSQFGILDTFKMHKVQKYIMPAIRITRTQQDFEDDDSSDIIMEDENIV